MKEPVLCYVEGSWCYFTTQELSQQWGDDWNDAPYEHNAGTPYGFVPDHDEGGPWEIVAVAIESMLVPPDTGFSNSPFTVQEINKGTVPWLRDKYGSTNIKIMAGTTLSEFKKIVKKSGGVIYVAEAEDQLAAAQSQVAGLVDKIKEAKVTLFNGSGSREILEKAILDSAETAKAHDESVAGEVWKEAQKLHDELHLGEDCWLAKSKAFGAKAEQAGGKNDEKN